ncbi:MAG: hypothetical protein EOP48_25190, partial [Sphingobacteriales bacterium]
AGIQLAHAGRKASCELPWNGGEQIASGENSWKPVGPSPIPFKQGQVEPHELTISEIQDIVFAFRAAAKRALDAGYKVVEIHAAHGYLLHEFFSPLSNKRTDIYGGSFENRIRLVIDVVEAVQSVWPENLPLFVRISATDWTEGGWNENDSLQLVAVLKDRGVDLIDTSSGGNVPDAFIPAGPNYQVPSKSLMLRESVQINDNIEFKLPVFWAVDNHCCKVKDLSELKAVMVVGAQSTGKTTLLHQIITSLLVNNHPTQLKFILADIKGIEFNIYKLLDRHFIARLPLNNSIISDAETLKFSLNALCIELDNRYDLLKNANERNIGDYNRKFIERRLDPKIGHQHLPFIVLIVDDLDRFTLYNKDEILKPLERIVNEGYKVGIISVIATSQFGGHTASGSLLSLIGQRIAFNLFSRDEYKRVFETVRLERHLEPGEFLYNEGRLILKAKTILSDFSIV